MQVAKQEATGLKAALDIAARELRQSQAEELGRLQAEELRQLLQAEEESEGSPSARVSLSGGVWTVEGAEPDATSSSSGGGMGSSVGHRGSRGVPAAISVYPSDNDDSIEEEQSFEFAPSMSSLSTSFSSPTGTRPQTPLIPLDDSSVASASAASASAVRQEQQPVYAGGPLSSSWPTDEPPATLAVTAVAVNGAPQQLDSPLAALPPPSPPPPQHHSLLGDLPPLKGRLTQRRTSLTEEPLPAAIPGRSSPTSSPRLSRQQAVRGSCFADSVVKATDRAVWEEDSRDHSP